MSDLGLVALIIGGILLFIAAIRYGFIGVLFDILIAVLSAIASGKGGSGGSSGSSGGSGHGGGRSGGGGSSSDW